MDNSIAVTRSGDTYIPMATPGILESTVSFSDALQQETIALQQDETTATDIPPADAGNVVIITADDRPDNKTNNQDTNNNANQQQVQPTEETASATAVSNNGLDTNAILLCMMMGGGFGGIVSALAMGVALSDDDTVDKLRGLLGSSSLFQTTATGGSAAISDGTASSSTINAMGSFAKAVAGTLNIPTEAWKKSTPQVVSNEGQRDPNLYRSVIEQFDVENNGRYTVNKMGYGDTYCNIFMWDVTSAMGAEIPHYINKNTQAPTTSADPDAIEMTANSTYDWLHEYGSQYGWKKVDEQTAQAYANEGKPAVSIYKASGHGHAQIISPSKTGGYDTAKGAAIAQAGRKLYDYAYTSDVYGSNSIKKVAFFVHA